jgi:RNA methyltransferase, TrmH family
MITSVQNATVKLILSLHTSSARKHHKLIILEHHRAITELLANTPNRIHTLVISEAFLKKNPQFQDLKYQAVLTVTTNVWDKLKTTPNSPGILALVHYPKDHSLGTLIKKATLLLGLNRIQDPKNLGAISRCAAAFHVDGLLLFPGCADPFHPDTIRSSVGCILDMPLVHTTPEACLPLLTHWNILGLDPNAKTPLQDTRSTPKTLLLLGSEGQGLELNLPYTPLKIPISPQVDSLNVSVATGIALYQITQPAKD